jgi:probable phosphoglycerate mutase
MRVSGEAMTRLALLRHGPTEWNTARRLQGRADIPLSDPGREAVRSWRLPEAITRFAWMASPLRRCVETAEILRGQLPDPGPLRLEPRLIEMDFGTWEGETLAGLRAAHGTAMSELEGRGLDFRAPGGESPRAVQDRLRPWLDEIAKRQQDTIAVTHKGVIRALYALATGWDMREKPPQRPRADAAQLFEVGGHSDIGVVELNLSLWSSTALQAGR